MNEWQLQDYLTKKWRKENLVFEGSDYRLVCWELMFPSWEINDNRAKWNETSIDFIFYSIELAEFLCIELKNIIKDSVPIVIAHKNYYNRPRPAQVNSNIVPPNTPTAKTPSYPSGHALQSYLVSKHLARQHPRHKRKFQQIAERIAKSRVTVGLHYPSDNALAYKLSQNL